MPRCTYSEEEVAKKYKDAEAWLSKWKDGDGSVKTLHGIDATKDLLSQLGPAAADCKFSSVILCALPTAVMRDARPCVLIELDLAGEEAKQETTK